MKTGLSKLLYALGTLGLLAASATPSPAETIYPFCKVGGGDVGIGIGYCNYATFEQCRISSAGYGMCTANPAYVAPAAAPVAQRRAKR
jgi:hypothetical protein